MIQDIAPHRFDNSFTHRREAREDDPVLIARKGKEMLLRKEGGLFRFPTVAEYGKKNLRFAFLIDDTAFFLGTEPPEDASFEWESESRFRTLKPQWLAFAAGLAGIVLLSIAAG